MHKHHTEKITPNTRQNPFQQHQNNKVQTPNHPRNTPPVTYPHDHNPLNERHKILCCNFARDCHHTYLPQSIKTPDSRRHFTHNAHVKHIKLSVYEWQIHLLRIWQVLIIPILGKEGGNPSSQAPGEGWILWITSCLENGIKGRKSTWKVKWKGIYYTLLV